MKTKLCLLLGGILGIFSLLVIALGLYDIIEIRPKLPILKAILQNASPQDRNPPVLVTKLIDTSFNFDKYARDGYITRLITNKLYPEATSQGAWHIRNLLWQSLLPLHFNETARYGIYSTMTDFGDYQGLNNFARQHYGKTLDQLTPIQSATTVAIVHSPTRFLRDSKSLDERANLLLEMLENQKANVEK